MTCLVKMGLQFIYIYGFAHSNICKGWSQLYFHIFNIWNL